MTSYLRLAWRNLWRNRRRTIITASSVLFAVFFALVMRAFQLGSYRHMVVNLVHAYTGYIQFHAIGYQDEPGMNNLFEINDQLQEKWSKVPQTRNTLRLESFVLASYGTRTRASIITGIIPDREDSLTSLRRKLIRGTYLSENDSGILVSSELSRHLKIDVGDTLVVLGQGYQGVSAAQVFPVRGILKFPSPELDKQMLFVSLAAAQELFSAYGMCSSAVFDLDGPEKLNETAAAIKSVTDTSQYEVITWEEAMPEMVQQIESDNASGLIMLGILYMIIGFGVIGTVLMMTAERRKEFGVMIAIGMKRSKLVIIQTLEMLILGLLGIVSGTILSLPLLYYFLHNPIRLTGTMAQTMLDYGFEPIMPVIIQPDYFISQAIVVFVIVLIATLIPAFSITRLTVIKALRK